MNVERVCVDDATRYRLRDIRDKYGIGVENLSGSANVLQTIHRLNLALMALDERLRKLEKLSPNDKVTTTELLKKRERELFPMQQHCAHVRAAARHADHCGGLQIKVCQPQSSALCRCATTGGPSCLPRWRRDAAR